MVRRQKAHERPAPPPPPPELQASGAQFPAAELRFCRASCAASVASCAACAACAAAALPPRPVSGRLGGQGAEGRGGGGEGRGGEGRGGEGRGEGVLLKFQKTASLEMVDLQWSARSCVPK